jgi:putative hydrolase of the HAD superfamily
LKVHTGKCSVLAIGFDVWGTLLDLNKVIELIALEIASETGLSVEEATRRIKRVHDEAKRIRRTNPDLPPSQVLSFSKELTAKVFDGNIEMIERAIADAFTKASKDVLFEDVEPALKELHNEGVLMGVLGNVLFWPSSYTRLLLDRVGIIGYFKELIFSDEIGYSKPDRKAFITLAKRLDVDSSSMAYVGDSVAEDIGGALSVSAYGVLINRRSRHKRVYIEDLRVAIIDDLRELSFLYRQIWCKGV